jgi:competence protein ComEA
MMNQWIEQHRALILSLIGLLIVGGVAALLIRWQTPAPIVIEPPLPTPTPGPIRVYVSGAVAQPDVYELPAGSIAQDALSAAGGPASDADLNRINLAASLADGEQVYVPHIGEVPTPAPASPGGAESAPAGPININTASQVELETLPGIGPSIAQRIIEYREANGPYPTIEAIQNVSGIGPSTFEQIKDLITVN